jgi:hypothetical protein
MAALCPGFVPAIDAFFTAHFVLERRSELFSRRQQQKTWVAGTSLAMTKVCASRRGGDRL